MPFKSDFNTFMDPLIEGVLGDTAIISPGASYPNRNDRTREVTGKYNQEYVEVNGVETLETTFDLLSSKMAGIVHGTMVEYGTEVYKVSGIQQDDTGWTRLLLEKQ